MPILSRCISIALCVFALTEPRAALALDPARTLAQFHHSHFSIEQGAPGDISAIVQAPDGYLLLAARDGLYRFDGVTFERLARPQSKHIDNDQVDDLIALRSGEVLAEYYSGPWAIYRDRRLRELAGPRPPGLAMPAVEDSEGRIWAQIPFGLAFYAHGRWAVVALKRTGSRSFVMDFLLARDGTLWIVTTNTIAFIPKGETHIHYTGAVISGRSSLAQDSSGQIWITDGLNSVRRLPDFLQGAKASQTLLTKADSVVMHKILFDRDGTLWGIAPNGVFRIPFQKEGAHTVEPLPAAQHFGSQDGLTSDAATSLFEDREGNIWVGTRMGLDMFRAANVVRPSGLPPIPFGYEFPQSGASIFAGATSLYSVDRDGSLSTPIASGIKSYISCLCSLKDGSIYTGQIGKISHFASGVLSDVPVKHAIFARCASDGNAVWYTMQGDGIAHVENDRVTYFPPPRTYSDTSWAGSILATPMGVVAYFHSIGIVRVDVQPWTTIVSEDAIGVGEISSLVNGDGLLIGGYRGVARLRGGRIDRLAAEDHPWLDDTQALARAPNGDVWIFSRSGLTRVTAVALEAAFRNPHETITRETFDMRDGLPTPASSELLGELRVADDGRIWVTTSEGVGWIDPGHLVRNRLAPPVSVRAVIANGRRSGSPRNLSLTAGTNNLEIDYTALSLAEPSRVQFRYKLDGVDSDWINPGQRRQAFYTKLGPGNYTFRVVASNNDGVWNWKGANLTFIIPPTFMQSRLFIFLCGAAVVALLWGLYSYRLNQIASRVRIGLEGRLQERERIARDLHDTLLQGVQGLILKFQAIMQQMPGGTPLHQQMELALDRADTVLVDGRDRVRDLRLADQSSDIACWFGDLGKQFAGDHRSTFRIVVEGMQRPLHAVVCDELKWIGQEALFNAFHHAQARLIEMEIVYHWRELRLRIRDNGSGIPGDVMAAGRRDGHFGLVGMRERAKRIHAEFTLLSATGDGTELLIAVPANVAYIRSSRGFAWHRLRNLLFGEIEP